MINEKRKMENDEIKLRLEKFMSGKIPVHIILKKKHEGDAPRFLNGILVKKHTEDIFVIDEKKLGMHYVLIDDIYDLNSYVDIKTLTNDFIKDNDIYLGEGIMKEEIDMLRDMDNVKTSFK